MTQLKNNIKSDGEEVNISRKSIRFRKILSRLSMSSPKIKILKYKSEDGNVAFETSMKSLGFTEEFFLDYKKEICSDFVSNFIGELLIRDHLNQFAEILIDIELNDHLVVNKKTHRNFGMTIVGDRLVYTFHVSLLQKILLEDIKRHIR